MGSFYSSFVQLYKLNDLVNDLLIEDKELNSIIKSHQRNKNLKEIGV